MSLARRVLLLSTAVWGLTARADSVAQVQTAKQITRETVRVVSLEGGDPFVVGDVAIAPGDILTFRIRFTPVPNGATRGLGGYITDYVPGNTEVVAARIVDKDGNTVPPHRGGLAQDGVGPRGTRNYPAPLENGSISQLYADTGIFFSTDARTARVPNDTFISVDNGIPMTTTSTVQSEGFAVTLDEPTGKGQLDGLLGLTGAAHAHNLWDALEAAAWGTGKAVFVDDNGTLRSFDNSGTGNAPAGYGSAVAGPDTHYRFETTTTAANQLELRSRVGPWRRIRTPGAEVGQGSPVTGDGPLRRTGIAADDVGFALSPDNPLPRETTAVRFAVGELVVGEEYFAEISLRVLAVPLDPVMNQNVNCAEVFGGDASSFSTTAGGKDNSWRYFVPSPSCVQLDLFFELQVDKIAALAGDTLTFTIEGINLAVVEDQNAVITFTPGAGQTFVSASDGGTFANGVVTWPTRNLAPASSYTFTVQTRAGNVASTLSKATYTSTRIPAPGFSVVSLTNLRALAIVTPTMTVSPDVTTAGSAVRYSATIRNAGTGELSFSGCATPACGVVVTLPAGFTPRAGTVQLDGAVVADPVASGTSFSFTGPASIAAGAQATLAFDVDIGAAVPDGIYPASVQVNARDPGAGRQIEISADDVAAVVVGLTRTATPSLDAPILATTTTITGSCATGAVVTVFINDVPSGTATCAAGRYAITVPTLFPGQVVHTTATGTGEAPSQRSASVVVIEQPGEGEGEGEGGEGEGEGGEGEGEGGEGEGEGGEGEGEGAEGEGEAAEGEGDGVVDSGCGCGALTTSALWLPALIALRRRRPRR